MKGCNDELGDNLFYFLVNKTQIHFAKKPNMLIYDDLFRLHREKLYKNSIFKD